MTALYLLAGLAALYLIFSIKNRLAYELLLKKCKKKLSKTDLKSTDRWNKDFLRSKRQETDPLADNTVTSIMKHHQAGKVNHLFEVFVNDSDGIPDEAPDELKSYFEQTAILPDWADPDLMDLGQQVYLRYGFFISLLLSYKSLPECYACAKGAEVLHRTARLNEEHGSIDTYSRRIAETAQFVFYAMSPGGLGEKGRGMHATQKVRLIHGVIRYHLNKAGWETEDWDEPVNHADMAGTLMAFSALILEGMELIGLRLTDTEKEAYVHCWCVVGHIMGFGDEMMPRNAADASALGHAILDDQIAESPQGKGLMSALLVFCNYNARPFLGEKSNIRMMRMMMGDQLSDMLGVPTVEGTEKMKKRLQIITRVVQFLDNTYVMSLFVQWSHKILLQMTINRMTKSNLINFYLPASLKKDWSPKTADA
jgi:hypothetical protein